MIPIDSGGGSNTPPSWLAPIMNPPKPTKKVPLLPGLADMPGGQQFGYQPVDPAPVHHAAAPVMPPPMPQSSPTGQYSLGPSGGGVMGGGGPGGAVAPAAMDNIPSPEDWLTKDDVYQSLLRRYNQNDAQFHANMDKTNSLLDTNAVEQTSGLNKQQGVDLNDLLQNYAGRGVVYSSGYGNNVNDVGNAYAQRLAAVEQNKTQGHADQASALADFMQNKTSDVESARADALARRLAKYGI